MRKVIFLSHFFFVVGILISEVGFTAYSKAPSKQNNDLVETFNGLNHTVIIVDGSRRWAEDNFVTIEESYKISAKIAVELAKNYWDFNCHTYGLWLLSTQNVEKRPKEQLEHLYVIINDLLFDVLKIAIEKKVRMIHLGRKDRIPDFLKDTIDEVEEATKDFNKYGFNFGVDYGGRNKIVEMVKRVAKDKIPYDKINEELVSEYMYTDGQSYPEVNLFIRTGGAIRTSGGYMWESQDAEWVFFDKMFPEFTKADLIKSMRKFQKRERRLGA